MNSWFDSKLPLSPGEELFSEIDKQPGETVVVGIGPVGLSSGSDLFIEACRKINNIGNYRFIWLGDDLACKDTTVIDQLAALPERCCFLGEKTPVLPYLQIADLVVFPWRQGSLPSELLAAIFLKKPVICLRTGSGGSYFVELHGGRVFDRPKPDPLVKAILDAPCEQAQNKLFLEVAGHTIKRCHNPETQMPKYTSVIRRTRSVDAATVGVVYLMYPQGSSYKKEKPLGALRKVIDGFDRQTTLVVVDNAAEGEFERQIDSNEYEISGDNDQYEFSGWQKGLQFIRSNDLEADLLIFVNDVFLADSFWDRRYLNNFVLRCSFINDALIGSRKTMAIDGEVFGLPVGNYIRTHQFVASRRLIDALERLPAFSDKEWDRILLPRFHPDIKLFRQTPLISGAVRDFVFEYLTRHWHRAVPYNQANFNCLRGKAVSLLNSLLLTTRVLSLQHPVIPFPQVRTTLTFGVIPKQLDAWWNDRYSLDDDPAVAETEIVGRTEIQEDRKPAMEESSTSKKPLRMQALKEHRLLRGRPPRHF
jgi:hypothetical protein